MFRFAALALMASTALTPAFAQTAQDDRLQAMQAQVDALQAQLDALKAQMGQPQQAAPASKPVQAASNSGVPTWKGAPQWEDKAEGWSFKPRGRLQMDAGYVSVPGGYTANRNLGFNGRVRRLRLGAEGTVPGGFAYKVDVDFANSAVGFGDVFLNYAPKGKPFNVKIGNYEPFDGLDQITSSNYITFLERAQMNDAFINTRRLGVSVGYHDEKETLRFETGLFAAHSIDSSVDNDGWIGAARAVYAPEIKGGRLHLAANVQHREFQSNNGGTASGSNSAPSINQLARYRARPFLQTTDVRFVDTGSFAASSDNILGLEFAGVFKKFYFASEAQWLKANAYQAGDLATGLDVFAGGNSAVTPLGDPSLFGGYAEIGYFLTGETRGYKENHWDRTKVLHPFSKGGWGAFQLAARLDYLDLNDSKLQSAATNNFTTGVGTLAVLNSRLGRGGTQTGHVLGLNWYPSDYVRFMVNYIHNEVKGGPFAAQIKPLSTDPVDQRGYSTDAVAVRAQVDF